jgi:hypothetical protein
LTTLQYHTYIQPRLNNENTMHCEQGSTDEMMMPETCRLFARARGLEAHATGRAHEGDMPV